MHCAPALELHPAHHAPSIAQVARLDKELLLVRKSAAVSSGSLRIGLERELLQRELRLEEERRGADEQVSHQTMQQVQTKAEQRPHLAVVGACNTELEAACQEARDDAALARAHWGAAESRVAELRAVTEKQAAALEEALAREATMQKSIQESAGEGETRRLQQQSKIDGLQGALDAARNEVSELQRALKEARADAAALEAAAREAQRGEAAAREATREAAEREAAARELAAREAATARDATNSVVPAMTAERDLARAEQEKVESALLAVREELRAAEREKRMAESKTATFEAELEASAQARSTLAATLATLRGEIHAENESRKALERIQQRQAAELKLESQARRALEQARSTMVAKYAAMRAELHAVTEAKTALERAARALHDSVVVVGNDGEEEVSPVLRAAASLAASLASMRTELQAESAAQRSLEQSAVSDCAARSTLELSVGPAVLQRTVERADELSASLSMLRAEMQAKRASQMTPGSSARLSSETRVENEAVKDAFAMFDSDSDGYLNVAEVRSALHQLGLPASAADAAGILRGYDQDADGKFDVAKFHRLVVKARSIRVQREKEAMTSMRANILADSATPMRVSRLAGSMPGDEVFDVSVTPMWVPSSAADETYEALRGAYLRRTTTLSDDEDDEETTEQAGPSRVWRSAETRRLWQRAKAHAKAMVMVQAATEDLWNMRPQPLPPPALLPAPSDAARERWASRRLLNLPEPTADFVDDDSDGGYEEVEDVELVMCNPSRRSLLERRKSSMERFTNAAPRTTRPFAPPPSVDDKLRQTRDGGRDGVGGQGSEKTNVIRRVSLDKRLQSLEVKGVPEQEQQALTMPIKQRVSFLQQQGSAVASSAAPSEPPRSRKTGSFLPIAEGDESVGTGRVWQRPSPAMSSTKVSSSSSGGGSLTKASSPSSGASRPPTATRASPATPSTSDSPAQKLEEAREAGARAKAAREAMSAEREAKEAQAKAAKEAARPPQGAGLVDNPFIKSNQASKLKAAGELVVATQKLSWSDHQKERRREQEEKEAKEKEAKEMEAKAAKLAKLGKSSEKAAASSPPQTAIASKPSSAGGTAQPVLRTQTSSGAIGRARFGASPAGADSSPEPSPPARLSWRERQKRQMKEEQEKAAQLQEAESAVKEADTLVAKLYGGATLRPTEITEPTSRRSSLLEAELLMQQLMSGMTPAHDEVPEAKVEEMTLEQRAERRRASFKRGASTLQARIDAEQREKEKEANIRSSVTRSSRASSSGRLSSDGSP